jgi:methylated-DNA-[protein]-cysteine S-methyltransferase
VGGEKNFAMTRRSVVAPAAEKMLYVFPSSLGWFAVAWQDERLYALAFGYGSGAEAAGSLLAVGPFGHQAEAGWLDIERSPQLARREVCRLAERLQAYADGGRDDFLDIPLVGDAGTVFQQEVLEQCRRIGYGKTCTYGQLAAQAGYPRAARAVGGVMARNRVPLIVPCHRVVGTAGALRGYSGCGGTAMKRRLLEREGVGCAMGCR